MAALPTEIMLLVLLGALLHASWNVLVKSSADKFLDIVLMAAGSAAVACLVLPFLSLPAPASWPFLAGSTFIHVTYFSLVAAAYRAGDLSYAYPIMRGTAPLLVALLSVPILGEHLSPPAWLGVISICAGVVGLAVVYRRPDVPLLEPTAFALTNALVIAGYTFNDGLGARASQNVLAYNLWLCLFTAVPLLGWTLWRRPRDLVVHLRRRWMQGLVGGAAGIGSYVLALWAMTQAPIAPVAALRETSILFGMALAALVLKERFGAGRHAAAAAVAVGAIVLKIA